MSKDIFYGGRHCAGFLVLSLFACIGGKPQGTSAEASSAAVTGDATDTSGASVSATANVGTATVGTSTTTGASSSTGTATTTGEDSQGSSNSDGCTFIDCLDTEPPVDHCNTYTQDCPEGMKCTFSKPQGTFCVDVDDDPKDVGEPCQIGDDPMSGIDDCGVGSFCWYVDPETGIGQCTAFCEGPEDDPSCADPQSQCSIGCQECVGVCVDICDPFMDTCPEGYSCQPEPYLGAYQCIYDASGDQGAYLDPCEFVNSCDPGHVCIDSENFPECRSQGCCTPYCDLNDPVCPDEDQGMTCTPFFTEPKPGLEHVGVCALPQP